jgi:hypothetical protein
MAGVTSSVPSATRRGITDAVADHRALPDLLAGVLAATLLLGAIKIGVIPLLAIPLAVATYAGLRLVRPWWTNQHEADAADQERRAYQAAIANSVALRALQRQIVKPAAREQVGRILNRTAIILAVMREDGSLAAAPLFNDRLLTPFRALLTQYVHLSTRGVTSASELLEQTETRDLPLIERSVDVFYERLHRSQVVDLATLREMLELNLESVATASSRRFTP